VSPTRAVLALFSLMLWGWLNVRKRQIKTAKYAEEYSVLLHEEGEAKQTSVIARKNVGKAMNRR